MTGDFTRLEKFAGLLRRSGAALFLGFVFIWVLLVLWDPGVKADQFHYTLKLAISGLLLWMLMYLLSSALGKPGDEPASTLAATPDRAVVGHHYPHGTTRETLRKIVLMTLAFLALTLFILAANVNNNWFSSSNPLWFLIDDNREVILAAVAAGLGSCLATILGFIRHAMAKKDFEDCFAPWYLLRPLMGSLLGIIFYFLIKGGLLALTDLSAGSDGNGALDQHALAGMAALVGFLSRQAIDKLEDIFNAMFSSTADMEVQRKQALISVRNATYTALKAEIKASGNDARLQALNAVWQKASGDNWDIGTGDETTLKAFLKAKLMSAASDDEKKALDF